MSESDDLFIVINRVCTGRAPRSVLEALADQMAQVLASCAPDHAEAKAAAAELFRQILAHVDAVEDQFGIPFRADRRDEGH
ncbi:hypothetical protein H1W37_19385 [Stappia taiwanensis]|uniref:Uncharacterized protein n=1 Tax=Stappia taiwanensis TaxID=992267 RepID=A0A838XZG1_9HYPH|nr:hypothetical protein [Stappia taiwanensis]MBA4613826.1 hypothetical protein [Stappia taiwanensis]GGE79236.1 hypothetical protein GCM10007285_03820 [Stappia taiwanensis]